MIKGEDFPQTFDMRGQEQSFQSGQPSIEQPQRPANDPKAWRHAAMDAKDRELGETTNQYYNTNQPYYTTGRSLDSRNVERLETVNGVEACYTTRTVETVDANGKVVPAQVVIGYRPYKNTEVPFCNPFQGLEDLKVKAANYFRGKRQVKSDGVYAQYLFNTLGEPQTQILHNYTAVYLENRELPKLVDCYYPTPLVRALGLRVISGSFYPTPPGYVHAQCHTTVDGYDANRTIRNMPQARFPY